MPEAVITKLTNLFRQDLERKSTDAINTMADEWLKVEASLKDQILLLATELAAPPGQVKLDPLTETIMKFQEMGYSPAKIGDLLAGAGIFKLPDVPKPEARQLKDWQLARLQRYVRLLAQTQREIEKYTGDVALPALTQLQTDAAFAGVQQALTLVDATISGSGGSAVGLTFDRLNIEAVQNIVAISGAGRPLGDLLEAAYPAAANGITNELIFGAARGRNPRETARAILDNGLAQGLNHILLLSRDQQNRAFREGNRQQYQRAGVVAYRRLAAKQSRTCPACLAMDNSIWPVSELMPLHPQDRCTMVPIVPGFEPIPFQTGEQWFKQQPADIQKQILGAGKYDLWKRNEFEFSQLATIKPNRIWGPNAQVTTLKDLKQGVVTFRIPELPKPKPPKLPSEPLFQPGPSSLPALDHDALEQLDLHKVGPDWGKQANWTEQSYGGVIFDEFGRVLLRKPTGEFGGLAWTFPKGKMEGALEHPVYTALREVEQETGHDGAIIGLVPGQFKGDTGQTNFFLMKSSGFDKSKMDMETEDLVWASFSEAVELIKEGKNKAGVKRDLDILANAMKTHSDLLTGQASNDYLFKPQKSTPTVITNFNDPLTQDLDGQAKNIAAKTAVANIKQNGKGLAVLDDSGNLKAIASFNDEAASNVFITDIWGQTATNLKTTLINTGKLAAGQGKGVSIIANDPAVEAAVKKLGFAEVEAGTKVYNLKPEWMKEWKKAPTKFKPPRQQPPPPEPDDYDRKSIAQTQNFTGLLDHAKKSITDPLAQKGVQAAIEKIQGGQKGFMYGKGADFVGIISYEEQPSIIKVGSAGFGDFKANLIGLKDVVKVAKQAGKDMVTFAPSGAILDQYLEWGFQVNSAYGNGASLILKKQNFDNWLKDPAKFGKDNPAALKPAAGAPTTYAPPPPEPRSSFKATPRPRQVDPLPAVKPLPQPDGFPDSPDTLQVIRRLGGSTGAELVEDSQGRQFVRKRGASSEHVLEEAYADAAYRAAGADVPEFKVYQTDRGPVKLARFIEGEPLGDVLKKGGARAQKAKEAAQALFATDALFGNRDVVGLDYDNILVDKRGKIWRIDNGGSFRFRAQGARKSDWDEYALDLWTLRDKATNSQTADVFGDLDFYSIADQIIELRRKRGSILSAVPEEIQDTLDRRLNHLADMATTARAMQPDQFRVEYADSFSRQRMELRHAGLTDQMPLAMDARDYEKTTIKQRYTGSGVDTSSVFDEEGRRFDRLRGQSSLVTQLRDRINAAGGDYDLIIQWAQEQAGNSWNPAPQALKYHLAQNVLQKPDEVYWWGFSGKAEAERNYRQYARNPDVYRKTFEILHAFTQEALSKMDLPNKDPETNTIRVFRTEDKKVMQGTYKIKPGQKNVVVPRGAAESTSIFDAVYIGTTELTRQNVPLHRFMATYFMEREPGRGGDMFLGDGENELLAILGDQPFDYVSSDRGAKILIEQ